MLERHLHGDILELRLNRPPVHALDPKLVVALTRAVNKAPQDGINAIVISSQPKLFSAGLDVPSLLALDRSGLTQFLHDFFAMLKAVGCSEIPVIAAMTGHAPAGGAVLGNFCDYRVMAAGEFRMGMNEAEVGLLIPHFIRYALTRLVGQGVAERMIVEGRMIKVDEALRIGMVNELVPLDEVIPRALAHARKLLAQPRQTMLKLRAWMRQDLHEAFNVVDLPAEKMAEHWFSEECQGALRAMLARVAQRKSA